MPIRSITRYLAPAKILAHFKSIIANPWIAYAMILLAQTRRIWNIWKWRGLSTGDTCFYFADSWQFITTHKFANLVYSPLYSLYYGSFIALMHDARLATILHRMVIALVQAVLVLAVMRQLLQPAI